MCAIKYTEHLCMKRKIYVLMFPQLLETVEISLQVPQFVVTLYFFDNVKFHAQRVSQDTQNNIWISWICGKKFSNFYFVVLCRNSSRVWDILAIFSTYYLFTMQARGNNWITWDYCVLFTRVEFSDKQIRKIWSCENAEIATRGIRCRIACNFCESRYDKFPVSVPDIYVYVYV